MRYVYNFTEEEFNNIMSSKQILRSISTKDLNWYININDYINVDKVEEFSNSLDIEVITRDKITFALVSLKDKLSKYKVYFIAYVDDQLRLRAYIPQYGNLYNPWTICHFGNESPFIDSPRSLKKMPEQYYEEDKELGGYKYSEQYYIDFENANLKEDKELMIQEFLHFHKLKE